MMVEEFDKGASQTPEGGGGASITPLAHPNRAKSGVSETSVREARLDPVRHSARARLFAARTKIAEDNHNLKFMSGCVFPRWYSGTTITGNPRMLGRVACRSLASILPPGKS